jgi:hypothetical protein
LAREVIDQLDANMLQAASYAHSRPLGVAPELVSRVKTPSLPPFVDCSLLIHRTTRPSWHAWRPRTSGFVVFWRPPRSHLQFSSPPAAIGRRASLRRGGLLRGGGLVAHGSTWRPYRASV